MAARRGVPEPGPDRRARRELLDRVQRRPGIGRLCRRTFSLTEQPPLVDVVDRTQATACRRASPDRLIEEKSAERARLGWRGPASTRKHVRHAMSAARASSHGGLTGPSRRGERSSVHRSATASSPSRARRSSTSSRRRSAGTSSSRPGAARRTSRSGLPGSACPPGCSPGSPTTCSAVASATTWRPTASSSTTSSPATEQTSMAMVAVGADGVPSYDFRVAGTADWQWTAGRAGAARSTAGRPVVALHSGSLALTTPPGAAVLRELMAQAAATATISYDPNCRPMLMGDPADVLAGRARAAGGRRRRQGQLRGPGLAAPPAPPPRRCSRTGWPVARRSSRSPWAATACWRAPPTGLRARRPGVPVTVIDTVGAGDTFSAALLAGLHDRGLLGAAARPALRAVDEPTLHALLDEAALAAAITCSRRGADPPTAQDVDARPGWAGLQASWAAGDGPRPIRHPPPTRTISAGNGRPARDQPPDRVAGRATRSVAPGQSGPRVLSTRSAGTSQSTARSQPLRSQSSWPGACASVSMVNDATRLDRLAQQPLGWVEPLRPGVDLDGDAVLGAGGEHRVGVELGLGALAVARDHPARAVAQHVDERVRDGRQHPLGHLRAAASAAWSAPTRRRGRARRAARAPGRGEPSSLMSTSIPVSTRKPAGPRARR